MPPPNPNRLTRRYFGLIKEAAVKHKTDAALGAAVRELLAAHAEQRALMVAQLQAAEAIAAALKLTSPAPSPRPPAPSPSTT